MKIYFFCFFLVPMVVCFAQGIRPNEERTLGTQVPNVALVDSLGTEFQMHDLKGRFIILSPIYSGCPSACVAITQSLQKAFTQVPETGKEYIVLSFSFNPKEGIADIRRFQMAHQIDGKQWRVAIIKNQDELFRLLDSLDFRYSYVSGLILDHPNLIVFLDDEMRIRHYEYGTDYTPEAIVNGLRFARKELTFTERMTSSPLPLAAAVLLLLGSVSWYLWCSHSAKTVKGK